MQRFGKIAPELFRNRWYRTKGDTRAAESMIECLCLQAARGWFVSEHEVEPVRLQLIDQRSNLRLTTHDMDRLGKIKRRLQEFEIR